MDVWCVGIVNVTKEELWGIICEKRSKTGATNVENLDVASKTALSSPVASENWICDERVVKQVESQ